jgi:plastocyanin
MRVPYVFLRARYRVLIASLLLPFAGYAANTGVSIINFSFQPPDITINVGDRVTWTQKDSTSHSSSSDTGVWSSPLLSLNQTFTRTFDTAGGFPYHCSVHPFMTAGVTVMAVVVNQPPTVSITSPSNGASVTGPNVTILANASDTDGSVAQVQFFEGRTALGQATSSPFQITVQLAPGVHNISAQATDNAGATGGSQTVSFTVATVSLSLSEPTRTADGSFQFIVSGTSSGQTYNVQASTDLNNWTTIQTPTASSATLTVTDVKSTGVNARYYRIGVQP